MGTQLFSFIYSTLRKRVNDPSNKTYWLPGRLEGVNRPGSDNLLLPLHETNWDLGNVTGPAGTTFQSAIMGQWWLSIGRAHKNDPTMEMHQAIACPDSPWPHLTMPELTIYGLDNVWPLANPGVTQPGNGYHTGIVLQFGYYDGQDNLPKLSQFQIKGQYTLTQCVCSAPATSNGSPSPTACDDWINAEEIHGVGNFTSTLTNSFVDATVDIQVVGVGATRALQVVVDKLMLHGGQAGTMPELTIDNLDVQTKWTWLSNNIWLPQAKRALESEDGRQAIIENLNSALNKANNRDTLTNLLTLQLNKIVDDTFGTVPAGMLPSDAGQQASNPVDQYFFDRLRFALNNPSSDYYLPKVIYKSTSPQLEPLQVEHISLGDQIYEGIQFQDLQLTQVQISGLTNIEAPTDQFIFGASATEATLVLSTLNPPPQVTLDGGVTRQVPEPPLTITGQFSMRVEGSEDILGGGFSMRINGASVLGSLTCSGEELDSLNIDFQKLQLAAVPAAASINLDIASAFKDIINQILNQDEIKNKVLQGVNDKVAQGLFQISQTTTTHIRKLIASRLDG